MSVFGSHNDRLSPAGFAERRPGTPDLTFQVPASPPAAPAPSAESARKASVLGKTLVFRGELSADEDLVLQGRVEGAIHHTQSLTVGVDGVVIGDIHAATIIVEGTVEGNLFGSASVLVGATAKVQGNIASPKVGIREGAQFNGAVDMGSAQHARRSVPHSDSAEAHALNERVVDRMLNR
jgi:cytoskeletal protein CcmA (bactofilin family)